MEWTPQLNLVAGHSKEEIENHFHFRLIRRALMKEYPFIIDLTVDEPSLHKYATIFVDVVVDPYKLSEYMKLPIHEWTKNALHLKNRFSGMGFNMVVRQTKEDGPDRGQQGPDSPLDLTKEVSNFITKIAESSAIPREHQLKRRDGHSSRFSMGDVIVDPTYSKK